MAAPRAIGRPPMCELKAMGHGCSFLRYMAAMPDRLILLYHALSVFCQCLVQDITSATCSLQGLWPKDRAICLQLTLLVAQVPLVPLEAQLGAAME